MNLCKTCGTICPFDDEHEECEYYKPMTNEDWLRSCNTEQLAEEIYECVMTHPWHISKEVILEWLKQPHHKKE